MESRGAAATHAPALPAAAAAHHNLGEGHLLLQLDIAELADVNGMTDASAIQPNQQARAALAPATSTLQPLAPWHVVCAQRSNLARVLTASPPPPPRCAAEAAALPDQLHRGCAGHRAHRHAAVPRDRAARWRQPVLCGARVRHHLPRCAPGQPLPGCQPLAGPARPAHQHPPVERVVRRAGQPGERHRG